MNVQVIPLFNQLPFVEHPGCRMEDRSVLDEDGFDYDSDVARFSIHLCHGNGGASGDSRRDL